MKLTQDWFEQQGTCLNCFAWVRTQFSDEVKEIEATEIINRLITQKNEIAERYKNEEDSENSLDWANWTICRVFSKEQRIKYAIFAAEQVIDIFEEQYPDDSRPREAIEAAKRYLEDQSTSKAANAAAKRAAFAAASNTKHTAICAAFAAAFAADHAAFSAVIYAANAAADSDEMRRRILKYGLELLQAKGE